MGEINMKTGFLLPMALVFCAAAAGAGEREITVELSVPDAAWTVAIDEVYSVADELWVISSVSRDPDAMGAQVTTVVRASLKLAAPDLPVRHYIVGKTWDWQNAEPYSFVANREQVERELASGKRIYPTVLRSTEPDLVLNRTWQWVSTTTPVEKIEVEKPALYTILLGDDGKVQARFDCNHGGGEFEIAAGKLSFGPLSSTRMACPEGSRDGAFMRDLQRVASFFVDDDCLYLELPYDSGTMRFQVAK